MSMRGSSARRLGGPRRAPDPDEPLHQKLPLRAPPTHRSHRRARRRRRRGSSSEEPPGADARRGRSPSLPGAPPLVSFCTNRGKNRLVERDHGLLGDGQGLQDSTEIFQ